MSTSIETRDDHYQAGSRLASTGRQTPPPPTPAGRPEAEIDRLHALAEEVRHAVVQATLSVDLDAKLHWWRRYRSARAQAMALLRPRPRSLRVVRG
jgi:hypothetical protein